MRAAVVVYSDAIAASTNIVQTAFIAVNCLCCACICYNKS